MQRFKYHSPQFNQPILRRKQKVLNSLELHPVERVGLVELRWGWGNQAFSRIYTRLDQIFILWGGIVAIIFAIAQFSRLDWITQAIFSTGLTFTGMVGMILLWWFWSSVERIRWVVCVWSGLMLLGTLYTDLGILGGWWQLLPYLCPVWLGLSALGYLITGWGMGSRAFLITGVLHLLGIALLSPVASWQFLITGGVMAGSLVILAEAEWDVCLPADFKLPAPSRSHPSRLHQERPPEQLHLRQLALEP